MLLQKKYTLTGGKQRRSLAKRFDTVLETRPQVSKYWTEFSLHRFEHRNFSLDDFEDAGRFF
jgi:hypothetical protein